MNNTTTYPEHVWFSLPADAGEILGFTREGAAVYTIDEHPDWIGVADDRESATFGGALAARILRKMAP